MRQGRSPLDNLYGSHGFTGERARSLYAKRRPTSLICIVLREGSSYG